MMDIYIDDELFKIQLWDTSGQEMFHALTKSFYRRAAAVILVYEERKRSTLNQLRDYWIPQLLENGCPATHLLIVGNKCDTLRPGKERVSDAVLTAMGTGYETKVCHLSAKDDNQGVLNEVMDDFCKRVLLHKFDLAGTINESNNPITSIRLNDENS
jgi:GTPase SAR1 family protein